MIFFFFFFGGGGGGVGLPFTNVAQDQFLDSNSRLSLLVLYHAAEAFSPGTSVLLPYQKKNQTFDLICP